MEFGFFLIPLVIDVGGPQHRGAPVSWDMGLDTRGGEWAVSCLEWSGCCLDRPLKSSFHFEEGMCTRAGLRLGFVEPLERDPYGKNVNKCLTSPFIRIKCCSSPCVKQVTPSLSFVIQ